MENRINQVITTENGNKYMILHQAIYNNQNYYVCCGVNSEENDVDENFYLFEEIKQEDGVFIKFVEDEKMAKFILEHLNIVEKDED